mmetsp:Transcript_24332/g.34889  ORF Transcript_24332/g.34889 Transcript_24332/m.34889 type:complete len:283 (-) Transcript_24332:132-980(-)
MESLLLSETPDVLNHVVNQKHNENCADCNASAPDWASLAFGTLICLQCAGYHRSFGTHVTLVRSLKLDSWSDEHIRFLELGGNGTFHKFVKLYCDKRNISCNHILETSNKYFIPEILYYRELLQALVDERIPKKYEKLDNSLTTIVEQLVASLESNALPSTLDSASCDSCLPHLNQAALLILRNKSVQPVSRENTTAKLWVPDTSTAFCMVCRKDFSLLVRRHHCRKCGRVVCKECAPIKNTRPIFEIGFKDPVRHCKECYRSPSIQWANPTASSRSEADLS